ncbi:carbohydrate ABC transporter permease [Acetivibrio clariflavus]|uniref:carbohydrate ABC transporter permease n=1 Tax=Acetivibrio clariflavus TaxID=288965 RepID=UPI0004822E3B|nr:sugar ABC transporter permease [Acetivibrio clariflavus]
MDRMLKDKKAICVFVLPAFIFFFAMVILPIIMSGYYSLLEWDGMGKGVFIGLKNYIQLFTSYNKAFPKALRNSIILAAMSVFIQLPISLVLALILARGIKGEKFYRTVYFMPVIISTVVIGQLWQKIYHYEYGIVNIILRKLGLESWVHDWLGDTKTALICVFLVVVWQYIGYHMLLMYSSAKSIPEELYEAALIDGASEITTAFKITIPLMKPILNVCVTYAIVGSLKIFDLVYVLTGGGPLKSTEVPSTLMYNTIFFRNEYGYGSAMAIFIVIECLVFTVLVQKIFKSESYF